MEVCFHHWQGGFLLNVREQIPERGLTVLFGPSGCGKTTLLRCIAGLERAQHARLQAFGRLWHDTATKTCVPVHRRPFGLVFQEASLFTHMSVRGNLLFGFRRTPAHGRHFALHEISELLGIEDMLDRMPQGLSGGECQRVAMARALLVSPRLLLMDEPLSALDSQSRENIFPFLERIRDELSIPILYVSHSLQEVARLADRMLVMSDGSIRSPAFPGHPRTARGQTTSAAPASLQGSHDPLLETWRDGAWTKSAKIDIPRHVRTFGIELDGCTADYHQFMALFPEQSRYEATQLECPLQKVGGDLNILACSAQRIGIHMDKYTWFLCSIWCSSGGLPGRMPRAAPIAGGSRHPGTQRLGQAGDSGGPRTPQRLRSTRRNDPPPGHFVSKNSPDRRFGAVDSALRYRYGILFASSNPGKAAVAPQMIQTDEELAALIARIRACDCVALDTEFVWERTFYPRLGIVQVGLPGGECALIDAASTIDLSSLGEILSSPQPTKVLHDAVQDLTILRRATGAFPRNVFDTRCAAGFVGFVATISLQELLSEALGVSLPKTETRTDWLKRPLSERQTTYALDDVRYLPQLRDELLSRARALGHDTWLDEDLTLYDEPAQYEEREPWSQFERIKGAGRLSSRRLAVLRRLAAWRESEARERDVPRDHVVADRSLLALSVRCPRNSAELEGVEGLPRAALARYGTLIPKLVTEGMCTPRRERPKTPSRRRRPNVKSIVDKALGRLRTRSAHERIDPGLVATRAELTSLAHAGASATAEHHRILRGWRYEFIGRELYELLAGRGKAKTTGEESA